MMSLGAFGVVLVILLLISVIYLLLTLLSGRAPPAEKLKLKLRDKIFFNAWIRYIKESYLKAIHVSVFILYTQKNNNKRTTGFEDANLVAQIVQLVLYSAWPFLVMGLLLNRRVKLEDFDFRRKFKTMYSGLNIKITWAILYTTFFCLRRLFFVLALLIFLG